MRQLLAQSDDDRRVAGWTVYKFKNGALSALLPLESKQSEAVVGTFLPKCNFKIYGSYRKKLPFGSVDK
jgi:hypothetical protein